MRRLLRDTRDVALAVIGVFCACFVFLVLMPIHYRLWKREAGNRRKDFSDYLDEKSG